ncbi:MAG: hypothetical protein M1453_08355 [Acidobacteria bacterium]|nr:hypothetical protein [Acidobacteriota bacterium]MCL5287986.1 hypothetical protein [Acidobacteriota bacterium]
MLFTTRLSNILFWIGFSVGLLVSALGYWLYDIGSHIRLGIAFLILFPGSLARGDLEVGPLAAEIFNALWFSSLNGCIYGAIGWAVVKLKSKLSGKTHH